MRRIPLVTRVSVFVFCVTLLLTLSAFLVTQYFELETVKNVAERKITANKNDRQKYSYDIEEPSQLRQSPLSDGPVDNGKVSLDVSSNDAAVNCDIAHPRTKIGFLKIHKAASR